MSEPVENWVASAGRTPAARELARRLGATQGGGLAVQGVAPAAQPFLITLLRTLFPKRPVLVVVDGLKTQESFQQDLTTWSRLALGVEAGMTAETPGGGAGQPRFYPAWEILPHEAKLPHADVISERLEVLIALAGGGQPAAKGPPPLVLASLPAVLQRTFPPGAIRERTRTLRRGDRLEPLDLVEWLEAQGYEPEAQVTQKSELALRGGILDVYPLTSPWPVRLEFFGDELESLRYFDPATQLSRESVESVVLPPGGELGLLRTRQGTAGTELGALPDYLPAETIIVACEPANLAEQAAEYAAQVPAGDPFYLPWVDFLELARQRGMTVVTLAEFAAETDGAEPPPVAAAELGLESLDAHRPLGPAAPEAAIAEAQRQEFFAQLYRWARQDYAVRVVCNNAGERDRFQEVWKDYGLGAETPFTLHLGALGRGFLWEAARLVVVTDAEIFGRYKVQRPRRLKSPHAQAARSALDIDFTELEEGDFVVHLQHGIGRYLGLQALPAAAGRRGATAAPSGEAGPECLVIEYAPHDPDQPGPKLYVPVTEAHLVSKYVGAGRARPPLNTLGGTRWAKAKAHAAAAVRDVAGEMLAIQAARDSQAGHAFAPDNAWQREFEGAFVYEETRDQLKAIRETKEDMERPKPMDRLICGDVGFGKTEVAIRAAFKAVMGGRQVAILVPTTVLAQQHFNTFRERMADYPVRVELLSRFRTPRERRRVLADLPVGGVDIVIGTHRLLQKDVAFKDLGLVVIDEEQRFGVLHKEKFKQLRRLVDVLTLSATPIPRTLYLALTGARDMSTLETAPQDRLPVETIVAQYDERLIRDAIQRELNRGGQVFFLHNRVGTIETMADKLRALVPRARVIVGHGQMEPELLEEVMTKFVNGEADVLLSTTIIESGLDIPNANTILIDRADRFGLSDLYQLRGRVGRYKHQAYAYLLLPRHAGLLADARKRIAALKQYSTLGSGFKIAMRDLEIRGAGNLLGPEQSGQITAVGFDLYCQLLKQSVAALKGEPVKPRVSVDLHLDFLALNPAEAGAPPPPDEFDAPVAAADFTIEIPREGSRIRYHDEPETAAAKRPAAPVERAPAFLPLSYVPEARQRIEVYRKLAQATEKSALDELAVELRDRFGPPPPAVELLLRVGELKLLAAARQITGVEVRGDKLMLTRQNDLVTLGGKFPRLSKKTAAARLQEIKRLLLSLEPAPPPAG